jgi:hypothetical protein
MLQYTLIKNDIQFLQKLMLKPEPLESEFWDVLAGLGGQDPVWMIIDGVDESTSSFQVLTGYLIELLTRKPSYRIIVLGRSHVMSSTLREITSSIKIMADLISQDINAYIISGIDQNQLLNHIDIRSTFSKAHLGGVGALPASAGRIIRTWLVQSQIPIIARQRREAGRAKSLLLQL